MVSLEKQLHYNLDFITTKNSNDCLEWNYSLDSGGYATLKYKGKTYRAHRAIFEIKNGPIGNLHVLHKCDNRKCLNIEHLFLGTNLDNVKDMMSKNRHVKHFSRMPKPYYKRGHARVPENITKYNECKTCKAAKQKDNRRF